MASSFLSPLPVFFVAFYVTHVNTLYTHLEKNPRASLVSDVLVVVGNEIPTG